MILFLFFDDFEKKKFSNDSEEFPLEKTPDSSDETISESFDNGILLTKEGIKKVISLFEEKIDTQILYLPKNEKISYKKIIYEQAAHYKRVMIGEEIEYKSYYFK